MSPYPVISSGFSDHPPPSHDEIPFQNHTVVMTDTYGSTPSPPQGLRLKHMHVRYHATSFMHDSGTYPVPPPEGGLGLGP